MFIEYDLFRQRADALLLRIADTCRAAGRSPQEVTLLPVTKTHPAAAADYALRYGFSAVGENRVQEAIEKRAQAPGALRWELIGHLQSNKAKLAAVHFERVQSVDSEKLINALDRAAGEQGKKLAVLLQINAGNDPAKFGAEPADAAKLVECVLAKPNLQVDGLMTIAPLSDDPEVARKTFANLRTIRDELAARFGVSLRELSMGMSGDLEAAIQEGSTMVRVGTGLYGPR
ncbi:YggS family pyridoxal phosphate-dependent enzyme [Oleiharenicola lentus]|uniref:YggS family pyridoxal phosphate-dependent enzyme n=1 Tax=Oleiharenicola lentus TaxID=2508720 RepID=UPI003F67E53F